MSSRVYHGYQQDLSQLPASVSTAYPAVDPEIWFLVNFQKIVVTILSAPDPAGALQRPQLEKVVGSGHPAGQENLKNVTRVAPE